MSSNALHTENVPGNVHQACKEINRLGLADYLVTISFTGGSHSIAVFRMPVDMVIQLRERMRWAGDHSDLGRK